MTEADRIDAYVPILLGMQQGDISDEQKAALQAAFGALMHVQGILRHERKHSHYFKDVRHLDEIDVYRVLLLFGVTDPVLAHIAKKALCAGQRGAKGFEQDVREIADAAKRRVEMFVEDEEAQNHD